MTLLDSPLLDDVMGKTLTAKDITEVLRSWYSEIEISGTGHSGHHVFFDELRIGTGYGDENEKRLDGWAIDTYPSQRLEHISFEIKISRSDFKLEMRDRRKRRFAMLYSNRFYFVTPKGLIKTEELPPEAGLIEIENNKCNTKVLAPWRDSFPPTWNFVAALCRRIR